MQNQNFVLNVYDIFNNKNEFNVDLMQVAKNDISSLNAFRVEIYTKTMSFLFILIKNSQNTNAKTELVKCNEKLII